MPPITGSPCTNQPPDAPSSGPPPCPVCAGPLIPLRDQYRCTRCFYSFCAGCENPDGYGAGGAED